MKANPPTAAAPTRFWIGTSGFQYPEWKGKFYPDKMSAAKMLPFYAERFTSTESNYSFRTMAQDQLEVMQMLGHESFYLVGHDRGAPSGHATAPSGRASASLLSWTP